MRATITFFLLGILAPIRAVEWRSAEFLCGANLPSSPGWQIVEVPPAPGITALVAIRNSARQALFGINVVEQLKGSNLGDPAVLQTIENLLHQFTYQFVGHSKVRVGAFDWIQYPVRSGSGLQQASGIVRFTSANGRVFGVTLLRGGGQDASQDVELQKAATSFHVLQSAPAKPVAGAPPPPPPPPQVESSPPAALPAATPKMPEAATASDEPEPGYRRYIVPGGVSLVVLIVLIMIIRGSGVRPVNRKG